MGLSQILVAVATVTGGLTLQNGLAVSVVLLGLSQIFRSLGGIFQRMATQTVQQNLAEVSDDISQIRSLVDQMIRPAPQFPDDPGRPESSGLVPMVMLAVMLSSGSAWAVQPKAIVNGPKVAEAGEELIFDASMSEGDPELFEWRVYPALAGKKQLTILDGGKRVRLSSYPGTYLIRLMVANREGISDHDHQVYIPGPVPCPPAPPPSPGPAPVVPVPVPNPVPTPGPMPSPAPVPPVPPMPDVLPAGEFDGLPAAVRALALAVNSASRTVEAAKLADALEAVASQISAGSLKSPDAIVKAIGAAFNGSVSPVWDTEFRVRAVARMKDLFVAGKLGTGDRWAAMLREVVVGLRSVK